MHCDDIQFLLPEFVRGTLSSDKVRTVRNHLDICSSCREEVSDLTTIRDTLLAFPNEEVFSHIKTDDIVLYSENPSQLSLPRTKIVKNHLKICAVCRREVELLRNVDRDLLQNDHHRSYAPWIRNTIWATAVIVLFLIIPRIFTPGPSPVSKSEQLRGRNQHSLKLLSPEDEAIILNKPLVFRWTPVSGAYQYYFTLYSFNGKLIWKEQTDSTFLELPDSISIRTGYQYVWGVEAKTEPIISHSSPLRIFEYRGP